MDINTHELKYLFWGEDEETAYSSVIDRRIMSSQNTFLTLDQIKSGKVVVFSNLKMKKIVEDESDGYILCVNKKFANGTEKNCLLRPPPDARLGARLHLENDVNIPPKGKMWPTKVK